MGSWISQSFCISTDTTKETESQEPNVKEEIAESVRRVAAEINRSACDLRRMGSTLDQTNSNLVELDKESRHYWARVENVMKRLEGVETELSNINSKIGALEKNNHEHCSRIAKLESSSGSCASCVTHLWSRGK